jgi:hypothetical protein
MMVDDVRLNGPIPELKDRLIVAGISCVVEVTKIVKIESRVDGAGEPVFTIFFKGPNRQQTGMLTFTFIDTQSGSYTIQQPHVLVADKNDEDDADWVEHEKASEFLGLSTWRYFQKFGWGQGKVTGVRKNTVSGAALYSIHYAEDSDQEDLDDEEFAKARAFAKMDPPPDGPPFMVEARLLNDQRRQLHTDLSASSQATGVELNVDLVNDALERAEPAAATEDPMTPPAKSKHNEVAPVIVLDHSDFFSPLLMAIGSTVRVARHVGVQGKQRLLGLSCTRVSIEGRLGCAISNPHTADGNAIYFDDCAVLCK